MYGHRMDAAKLLQLNRQLWHSVHDLRQVRRRHGDEPRPRRRQGFLQSQAQTHIAHALEMLFELNRPVTLQGAFELLSDRELLEEEMENLEGLLETPRQEAVYAHFANRFSPNPTSSLAAFGKPSPTTCRPLPHARSGGGVLRRGKHVRLRRD